MFHTITGKSKKKKKAAHARNITHTDKGKIQYGYPKYSNYSHWCVREKAEGYMPLEPNGI